jgi:hypothetical protein
MCLISWIHPRGSETVSIKKKEMSPQNGKLVTRRMEMSESVCHFYALKTYNAILQQKFIKIFFLLNTFASASSR